MAESDKLENRIDEIEHVIKLEQARESALREGLKLWVDSEFGIGSKLDALHALRDALMKTKWPPILGKSVAK